MGGSMQRMPAPPVMPKLGLDVAFVRANYLIQGELWVIFRNALQDERALR
jgi:hypothetical protein